MILVFDICGGMALRRRERRPGAPGDTRRAATIAGPSSAATALPLPPPSSVPGSTIREAADATARGVLGRPVGFHGPTNAPAAAAKPRVSPTLTPPLRPRRSPAQQRRIKLQYINTDAQIADILTKPLQGEHFRRLRKLLLNW